MINIQAVQARSKQNADKATEAITNDTSRLYDVLLHLDELCGYNPQIVKERVDASIGVLTGNGPAATQVSNTQLSTDELMAILPSSLQWVRPMIEGRVTEAQFRNMIQYIKDAQAADPTVDTAPTGPILDATRRAQEAVERMEGETNEFFDLYGKFAKRGFYGDKLKLNGDAKEALVEANAYYPDAQRSYMDARRVINDLLEKLEQAQPARTTPLPALPSLDPSLS